MPLLTDIPNYFKKTFKGATALTKGLIGLVPAPEAGDEAKVLKGDGTWGTVSGGITDVGTTIADVFSVSGSDLVADDGGTVDSADPFIKWDDAAGKLVYANPLSRPTGAFYVGVAPTTTALGTDAVNIQSGRSVDDRVASATNSVAIGYNSKCSGNYSIAVGGRAVCTGVGSTAVGENSQVTANDASGFGNGVVVGGINAVALGRACRANSSGSIAVGYSVQSNAVNSINMGGSAGITSLRSQFSVRPFDAIYWGGQTTNDTPTILNLDATATNRFTIAANTLVIADLLIAANSTGSNKALVARRWVAIRRDNDNNTTLVGTPQAIGTDQSTGSPTWDFNITADDVNEALQFEAIGATDETINWRVTAFYRVA